MVRMSPDSLEYFAVEPRAITRRYEKRERPVKTSSLNPSANALNSALPPLYLKGSTATQKPSSVRVELESALTTAREVDLEMGGAGCLSCQIAQFVADIARRLQP